MLCTIDLFKVSDTILVGGQTRKNFSRCMGKIGCLMLENLWKVDILQFI